MTSDTNECHADQMKRRIEALERREEMNTWIIVLIAVVQAGMAVRLFT